MEQPVAASMMHLLRAFADDIALRRARTLRRLLLSFTAIKLSAFVAVGALVWLALTQTPPGALDPGGASLRQDLLISAFDALFILQIADFAAGTSPLGPMSYSQASHAFARMLTNAVAARDARLTRGLPAPPPHEDAASASAIDVQRTIGPLAHPMRALALNNAVYLIAALGGGILVGMGVIVALSGLRAPATASPSVTLAHWMIALFFPLCLIVLGAGGCAAALVTRRFAHLERQSLTARMDASGVTFTRAGDGAQPRRLAWHDARGFARLAFTDDLGRLHEVFALSGPDQDYLWEALYDGQQPGSHPEDDAARVAALQLNDAIIQRAGLPLLDLTPTLNAVLASSRGASSYPLAGLLARARKLARRRGDSELVRAIDQCEGRSSWLLARIAGRLGGGLGRLSPRQQEDTLRLARDLLPYYPTPAQIQSSSGGWRFAGGYVLSEFVFQALIVALAVAGAMLAGLQSSL
jgi:hypothetical protein